MMPSTHEFIKLDVSPFKAQRFRCAATGAGQVKTVQGIKAFEGLLRQEAYGRGRARRGGLKGTTSSHLSFVPLLGDRGDMFQTATALAIAVDGPGSPVTLHQALKEGDISHGLYRASSLPAAEGTVTSSSWILILPFARGMYRPRSKVVAVFHELGRRVSAEVQRFTPGFNVLVPLDPQTQPLEFQTPLPSAGGVAGAPQIFFHHGHWALDPDGTMSLLEGAKAPEQELAELPEEQEDPGRSPGKRDLEKIIDRLVEPWAKAVKLDCMEIAVPGLALVLRGVGFTTDAVVDGIRRIALRAGDPFEQDSGARSFAAVEALRNRPMIAITEFLATCGPMIKALVEATTPGRRGLLDALWDLLTEADPDDQVPVEEAQAIIADAVGKVQQGMVLEIATATGTGKTTVAVTSGAKVTGDTRARMYDVSLPDYPGPARDLAGVKKLELWNALVQERLRASVRSAVRRGRAMIAIAVPDYEMVWQIYRAFKAKGIPVRLALSPTSKTSSREPMCRRSAEVVRAVRAGLNPKGLVCIDCENRKGCDANRGFFGSPGAQVVVGVHDLMPKMSRDLVPGGTIVVDEVPNWKETAGFAWNRWPEFSKAASETLTPYARGLVLKVLEDLRTQFLGGKFTDRFTPLHELLDPGTIEALAGFTRRWTGRGDLGARPGMIDVLGPFLKAMINAARCNEIRLGQSADGEALVVEGPKPDLLKVLRDRQHGMIFLHSNHESSTSPIPYLTGTVPTCVTVDAVEKARVTRLWMSSASLTRSQLLSNNRQPKMNRVVRPLCDLLERARRWDGQPGGVLDLLLVTFRPIALRLKALVDGAPPRDGVERRVHTELVRWFTEGRRLQVRYFGDLRGRNDWEKCDGCVTIADPRPNLESARREAERFDADFDSFYKERVRAELAQVFGRLRAVRRTEPLFMAHAGNVIPAGWHRLVDIRLIILSRGNPPATSGVLTGPELKALRARTGMTQVQFSRALNVSERSLRTAESTEGRLPKKWEIAVSKLQALSEREQKEGG